ncbi:hypothetical protein SVIOM74S_01852 [Streptomyces violarus]
MRSEGADRPDVLALVGGAGPGDELVDADGPLTQTEPDERPGHQPEAGPVAEQQQHGRRDEYEGLQIAAQAGEPGIG